MKIDIGSLWVKYVSVVSLAGIVLGLYYVYHLPFDIVLGCVILLLVGFITIALSVSVFPYLSSIDETLRSIEKTLKKESNLGASDPPNEKKEEKKEEIRTTGGGALVGMTIGGLIGLLGGPVGVVIVGLIGAAIGNQAEYESIKAEKEKKKKK